MPLDTGPAHHFELLLPHLPASLQGLRIAHVTDLHVRRFRPRHRELAWILSNLRLDLIVWTGDYTHQPWHAAEGMTVMQTLCRGARPRLGMYGIFGNHDDPAFRRQCQSLPITWIDDRQVTLPGLPMVLWGSGMTKSCTLGDPVAAVLSRQDDAADGDRPLHLLLSHTPVWLPVAADLGIDLMLAGHTHGGQIRPWPGKAMINSTLDWPLRLTSGLLRHRDTLCAVSRGLGESGIPWRFWCPHHLPIYTLRRGSLPGRHTPDVDNVRPW
ncbi:MAG: metallophosphoesterase [Phycisphaeraceae bacterium]|nr:metallophosphoesterase [Phycisphaeraceae bacterium]